MPLQYLQRSCTVPEIPAEVVEAILFNLDIRDVIRAKQACTVWRDFIDDCPKLLRITRKKPLHSRQCDNPHFEKLSEDAESAIILHGPHVGVNLGTLYEALKTTI